MNNPALLLSSSLRLHKSQTASHLSLATSHNALCRGKCVFGSSLVRNSAQVSDRCDSGQNKTQFSKESKLPFLPPISILPLCSQSAQPFQPLAMRAEAWQAIPGVSTWLDEVVHSNSLKTTANPRCARHHSAQRGCSSPLRRGDETAEKRSHRNCFSSPERVRLLQPLLLRPQKKTAACDLF